MTSEAIEQWAIAHAATIDVGASVAVVVTLIVMAQQSRHSATLAGTDALRSSMLHLAQVESAFIERPHLRAYFHDGEPLPVTPDTRAQVLTIASALADCLESAIFHADTFAADDLDDWRESARVYLASSPALRAMVANHLDWWPGVAKEYSNVQRGALRSELRQHRSWWHKPIVTAVMAGLKGWMRARR